MKKTFLWIYILGTISLCTFLTPISKKTWEDRDDIVQTYTTYSNVFNTQGQINVGRFFIFLTVWSMICYALYVLLKEFKPNKSSFN